MNGRTLLIIAGLVLPIVVLGALTIHSHKEEVKKNTAPPAAGAVATAKREIEAEKAQHHARLAELEKMTDADWPVDKVKYPHHAPTREAAIAWQKSRLAWLDKMTPEEWAKGRQQQSHDWQEWEHMHPANTEQTVPKHPLPPLKQ